jgi:uncharacterized membrane protein YsdA (DUF1294 family)
MENFPLLIPGIVYAGLNVLAFGAFALDKHRAKAGSWRTPEMTLLAFAALGPFGAFAAMKTLRHKTRHGKFLLVPFFAIIHILLLFYFFTPVLR